MKNSVCTIALTLLCIALVVLIALFGISTFNLGGVFDDGSVSLGLDLVGGSSITFEAIPEDNKTLNSEDMNKSLDILRKRLDEMNYNEAVVSELSGNRVRVEIPGINDPEEASKKLGSPAKLTFREFGGKSLEEITDYNTGKLIDQGNVVIEGKDVVSAEAFYGYGENGIPQWMVNLKLNEKATKALEKASAKVKDYSDGTNFIAIVLDDEIQSAPLVSSVLNKSDCSISISNTNANEAEKEARDLSILITLGQLPVSFEPVEVRAVSATQGTDALETSITAGAIGIIIVMIFMIAVYRLPGVVSGIALIAYTAIFGIILVLTKVNLSLAGIAGIVLTIGMAVDSNVIIYERIKEELRSGKTLRSAVKSGFERAFTSILDANITTLIAAGVLWALGTGPVQGFAKTLFIGVIISLFTALVITRVLLKATVDLKLNPVLFGAKKTDDK